MVMHAKNEDAFSVTDHSRKPQIKRQNKQKFAPKSWKSQKKKQKPKNIYMNVLLYIQISFN